MRSPVPWFVLVAAFTLAGCGADSLAAMESPTCPESLGLSVTPYRVTRGASTEIGITWRSSDVLADAVATLTIGTTNLIEVDLPLIADPDASDDPYDVPHVGSLLNPFGSGSPSGGGRILATADPAEDCLNAPSATSAFELQ